MKTGKRMMLGFVLVALASMGLAACGGEAPTATPLPPTSTPVPPTATTAPTSTPEAASPGAVPTATIATGTSSGAGTAATDADLALISQAFTNTEQLTSYHFIVDVQPSDYITQPVNVQGDFVSPDKTYIKGTFGAQNVERLSVGGKVYDKGPSGNWVEQSSEATPTTTGIIDPQQMVANGNPVQGIGDFVRSGTNFRDVGTETIDGVSVRHFTFDLDVSKMLGSSTPVTGLGGQLPSIGGGGVWIDPQSKTAYRVAMNVDLGPMMQLITGAMSAISGTPTAEAQTPVPPMKVNMTMDITKHNDPSITIPQP